MIKITYIDQKVLIWLIINEKTLSNCFLGATSWILPGGKIING